MSNLIKFSICILLGWLVTGTAAYAGSADSSIVITGHITRECPIDTITLTVHGDIARQGTRLDVDSVMTCITNNGNFRFVIRHVQKPVYLSMSASSSVEMSFKRIIPYYTFSQYLFRAGDSIHINTNWKLCHFSGSGAERLSFLFEMDRRMYLQSVSLPQTLFIDSPTIAMQYCRNKDSLLVFGLHLLETHRNEITAQDYNDFKANISASHLSAIYSYFYVQHFSLWDKKYGDTLLMYYGKHYYKRPLDTSHLMLNPDAAYYNSYAYIKTVTDDLYEKMIATPVQERELFTNTDQAPLLIKNFRGRFLDKMLYTYMLIRIAKSQMDDAQFNRMIHTIQTPLYLEKAIDFNQRFGTGRPITGFSFENRDGKTVTLNDFKGKLVFIDMWFTGCGGCVTVAAAMPAVEKAFEQRSDIVFVSLSIDQDKKYWLTSINPDTARSFGTQRYTHYTTPSTVYLYTGGTGHENAFIRKYVPTNTYPHLMLIDKNGNMLAAAPPRPDAKGGTEALIQLINRSL